MNFVTQGCFSERRNSCYYDAWGRLMSTTGDKACTLGTYNPLRYRGYVYDWETGLYYLQSRYYNPEMGRFINADSLVSTGQGLLGHNMFAYCGNNPVSRGDARGYAWYDTLWDWVNTIAGCLNTVSTLTAIGSVTVKTIDYYSMPWERTADLLGGVKENRESEYKSGSLAWGIAENLLGPGIIPFWSAAKSVDTICDTICIQSK